MPATLAKFSSLWPPADTALAILTKNLETAEPPRSAAIPNELKAAEIPRMSASLTPKVFNVPTKALAIDMISVSVVAELLPKCTKADPIRSILATPVPVTLVNRAIALDASSLDSEVAVPIFAITWVNRAKSSCLTPN